MTLSSLGLNRLRWSPELAAILLVYFVQGALGLAQLAMSFYFKDELGVSPAQMAALLGITSIPWTIKPLYGWMSDRYPIARYRRRPYLLLSGTLGCLAWSALATIVHSAWAATVAMTVSSLSIAIADVIVDAIVVERTRLEDRAGAGTLQSLAWGSTAVGSIATAYWGGALLDRLSPQAVFGLTATLPLLVAIAALAIAETPLPQSDRASIDRASTSWTQVQQVWRAIKLPSILLPTAFIVVWQATPSAESAFFYFVTNDLGFGPEFLGRVRLATSIASLIGIGIFQRWLRAVPLRSILFWITLISFGLGMTSLILVTHTNRLWGIPDEWFSLGDSVVLTAAGQIAFMPILVLAARLCPAGIEATLFALLMSLLNLSGLLSKELGALLMQGLGVTETEFSAMTALVVITNLTTLLPLPLLRWLPDDSATGKPEPEAIEDLLLDLKAESPASSQMEELAGNTVAISSSIAPSTGES
ncbi:folate/biopterin family MFS transporter [Synechococcus sp. PCC 7336]|uniref:folate/biopterin family MFS transporter n=1 Tax=Synechococcus sp. PCC 7336 TaxID=195250 RepID=UPI0003466B69|nr:folate/biopterin family MFS transporter [Synechococcus sp. PCC 7336]